MSLLAVPRQRPGTLAVALLAGSGAALAAWKLIARRPTAGPRTRVVVLGLGYCGGAIARCLAREERCEVVGTTRSAAAAEDARAGVRTLALGEASQELEAALRRAELIIATAPPGEAGDPFLQDDGLRSALEAAGRAGAVVIYLSSVGVYGDQGGARVTEETPPAPRTARAKRRVAAEEAWRALPVRLAIVRLPGIYGPWRGPLAKAREGNVRIVKEGHVFSRIHVDDVVQLCTVLLRKVRCGDFAALLGSSCTCVVNCCDGDPAPQHEVAGLAYELLGRPVPPAVNFETADLSAMQRSFYEESRLMANDKLLSLVGDLVHPSYQTGLRASLAQEQRSAAHGGLGVMKKLRQTLERVKGAFAAIGSSRETLVALVDNGSLKPEATLSLRRLAAAVEAEAKAQGRALRVHAVSARWADRIPARELEGRPAEVLSAWLSRVAAASPRRRVLLLPLLIGPSVTITKSMPSAARAVPQLEVEVAPPLVCLCPALLPAGASGASEVAAMLADRVADVVAPSSEAAAGEGQERRVLLCDHGSPTAQVAAAREAVRLQLEKRLGLAVAGCCMERREGEEFDFNGPLLEDALLALPQGVVQVTVALLFLQEGRHAGPGGDIAGIVEGVRQKRPDLAVVTTKVLAGHPLLVELLLRRLEKSVPVRLLP